MVPRNRDVRQGTPALPPTSSGFLPSTFMPLTLIQIQQLVERPDIPPRDRLTYAVLALHADCMGDVYARVRDIAAATGRETESCRRVLKRLRRDGHLTTTREYRGRRVSRWHITAVRGQAPAA